MKGFASVVFAILLLGSHAITTVGGEVCQGDLALRLLESEYLPSSFPSLRGCTDLLEVNDALAAALSEELLRPMREVDDGALVRFLEEVRHGYLDGDHKDDFAVLVQELEEALGGHGYRSFLDVSEGAKGRFESLDPLIREIRRETRDAWSAGLFQEVEQPARKPFRAFPSKARNAAEKQL